MREELLKGLSEEQITKAKACKNQEELLKLVKQEGIELNNEQLEAINGGGCGTSRKCPKCKSNNYKMLPHKSTMMGAELYGYKCLDCGYTWEE